MYDPDPKMWLGERGRDNVNVDSGRFPKPHLFLERSHIAWRDTPRQPMFALNDDSLSWCSTRANPPHMLYHCAMTDTESLLEFPCTFPIKVMGRCDSGFEATALAIVRRHVPDFDVAAMRTVASRQGNYLSVTFTIEAVSREQLDNLYRELTASDELLMVL